MLTEPFAKSMAVPAPFAEPEAGVVAIAAQNTPAPRIDHGTYTARVVKVVDGDTVDVRRGDGGVTRIRIHGIDCPEDGRPFAAVARRFTRTLVFDRDVVVAPLDRDRYGRTVARIRVDGSDVSESLVQAGLAWHFRRYSDDPRLDALEREAREAGRGVWRDAAPGDACPPGQRCALPGTGPAGLVQADPQVHGNVSSLLYHAASCRNYTCKNCTAVFRDSAQARAAGFRPAGDCFGGAPGK